MSPFQAMARHDGAFVLKDSQSPGTSAAGPGWRILAHCPFLGESRPIAITFSSQSTTLRNDSPRLLATRAGRRGADRRRARGHRRRPPVLRRFPTRKASAVPERPPNELFASWFTRSGWSKGEVARLVNRRARDLGATHVATDTSRVRRWLDGEQPRDPIPRILTELFSERFGSVVTLSDLGLREPASPIAGALTDLPWSGERIAELMAEFCRSDLILGRRGAGAAPPLAAGAALVEPVKRWLLPAQAPRLYPGETAPAPPAARPARPQLRPGRAAVLAEQLEEAVRTFREWDAAVGGGIRRAAVVGQLYEVAQVLRQLADPAQPRLFRVAAQFALLAGEMSFDANLQATAQRYLILALHAAKESTDRSLAVGILAAMGRQLIHLNRAQDALDLVAVGRAGMRAELDPLVGALADTVEARAYGALGRAESCRSAAERAAASTRRPAEPGPDWLAAFTPAALRTDLGQAFRDLSQYEPGAAADAVREFGRAVALFERDRPAHLRRRVEALAGLACVQAAAGDAAAAGAALRTALSLAVRLRSRYTEDRLREAALRARAAFPHDPDLKELAERFREGAPPPAAAPPPVAAQSFTRA
jgi:hypothetical protein